MQTKLSAVLQKTRTLAEQRGWSQVAELSTSLCNDGGIQVVIAAPADVENTPLVEWAKGVLPEAEIVVSELESLARNPVPALKASKLIAVFECGKIIQADAMDALSSIFFGRPSSSYAIVLSGAELVDTPEELETVQRAAWRVLVPDPKPDWGGQDLLQQGCFLWSEADSKDFLHLRVERDKTALAKWLKASSTNTALLERDAALYVLDLAETHLQSETANSSLSTTQDSALETRQMDNALESLSNTRRHLVRRLDADASSLERQLTASLQTLEQDMLHTLPAHLHKQAQLNKQADVQQVLNDFISSRVFGWQTTTHSLLSARGREITSDIESMFGGIDWELINRVAARQGELSPYPQVIIDKVIKGSPPVAIPSWLSDSAGNDNPPSPDFVRKALGAAMIVGVGAVLLGTTGIIAGTVATVVGVRKMHRIDDERRAEAYGRTAIRDVIGRAIAHVRELSNTAIGPTRDAVNKELRSIEEMLDRGLAQSRNSSENGTSGRNPDRDLLDELRLQVMAA
ncbi:hypothetical protein IAD21_06297 [Abditibacteriota bacterium]|nr:hypothetical protein IAD21_06297 [Abditibacteriota bacterium]